MVGLVWSLMWDEPNWAREASVPIAFGYTPSIPESQKHRGIGSSSRRAPTSLSQNTTIAIGNSICCQARGLAHRPVP